MDPSNPEEPRLSTTSRRSVVTLIPDEPLKIVSNVTITLLHLKRRNIYRKRRMQIHDGSNFLKVSVEKTALALNTPGIQEFFSD